MFSDEVSLERGSGGDQIWVWRLLSQKWDPEMIEGEPRKDIRQMFWGCFWYRARSWLVDMKRDGNGAHNGYTALSLLQAYEEGLQDRYEPGMIFQ